MSRVFMLSEASYGKGSDYDIVMLYQVLLGRNPENSQVIQDHRSAPFNRALQTFLSSPEFRDSVLDPIEHGSEIRRHDIVPRPSPEHLDWLFGRSLLDEGQKTILRQATNWEQFFQYLCSLDGFLNPFPQPAGGSARVVAGEPARGRRLPESHPGGRPAAGLAARVALLEASVRDLQQQLAVFQSAAGVTPDAAPPADGNVKPSRRRQAR